jgi:hypothetical protein
MLSVEILPNTSNFNHLIASRVEALKVNSNL